MTFDEKMKKTITAILALLVMTAIAATYHIRSMDGLDGLFFSRLFQEDTVYAPGYSDTAFRKVTVGMSQAEVLALLGPPISEWESCDNMAMGWSRSPGDTHYRQRAVFFQNGVVTKSLSEFFVD